jgi:hypothetical protein
VPIGDSLDPAAGLVFAAAVVSVRSSPGRQRLFQTPLSKLSLGQALKDVGIREVLQSATAKTVDPVPIAFWIIRIVSLANSRPNRSKFEMDHTTAIRMADRANTRVPHVVACKRAADISPLANRCCYRMWPAHPPRHVGHAISRTRWISGRPYSARE